MEETFSFSLSLSLFRMRCRSCQNCTNTYARRSVHEGKR